MGINSSEVMQYRSLMWRTFFCVFFVAGATAAGASFWLEPNQTASLVYGILIAALPQMWAVAKTFRVKHGKVVPQAALLAAWVKFGLCALGFAWVFTLPDVTAGAVFSGFIMQMLLITAGNSWVAMATQKS
jgi:hypothetical protein